jgi:hypothetical protein
MKQSGLLFLVLVLVASSDAWAGDGVVALQTADPSCGDNSSAIYVDCGNGAVTDNRSGLVWLANANCFGGRTWEEAMTIVSGLSDLDCGGLAGCDCGLEDGSSPGEWRLPSRKELRAMVADAFAMGCFDPTITNDSGVGFPDACWDQNCVDSGGCSIFNVQSSWYWTSSYDVMQAGDAWEVWFFNADVNSGSTALTDLVWPVRGGQ